MITWIQLVINRAVPGEVEASLRILQYNSTPSYRHFLIEGHLNIVLY
jgi:hypothetical protein